MSNLPGEIKTNLGDVQHTFSSWDACMSKTYCKWPAIAGIVIGSLILLSVVWCVASCLCCGATLCGSCVRCLTCFGCCGACGNRGGGGGGRTRHKDDYSQMPPTPYNGYQGQPAPMTYHPPTSGPQFAQFDTPTRNVHADSLPAMPTWDTARTRRVEDHSESANGFGNDVEMGRMNAVQAPLRTQGGYNQVPHGPASPMLSPAGYGHFEGQAHPYSSDLGARRLLPQQTGYTDFEPSPLSPAPTYRTAPSIVSASAHDGYAHGPISPPASEYNSHGFSRPARDQAWSPLPESHHEDTAYHSHQRSLSPPMDHSLATYDYQQHDQGGVRPPSLLQIGRKPVVGSHREI